MMATYSGVSFPGLVQLAQQGPSNRPTTYPSNTPTTTPTTVPLRLGEPTLRPEPSNRPTVSPSTLPQGRYNTLISQPPGSRPLSTVLLQAFAEENSNSPLQLREAYPSDSSNESGAPRSVNFRA